MSVKIQNIKTSIFLFLSTLFFAALTIHIAFSGRIFYNEIGHHLQFAKKMEESGHILMPHFLFHAIAIGIHKIVISIDPNLALLSADPYVDNSWIFSCIIILTAVYAATLLLLKKYFRRKIQSDYMAMFLAFSLLVIQPIFAFAFIEKKYYLGYITPSNIYIIPTQILLKLTTIALFMMTPLIFRKFTSRTTIFC